MSGDLEGTALAVNMYQRMPQLATMNTVYQRVPRLKIPEAILEGRMRRLSHGSQDHRRPVPEVRLSCARAFRNEDVLQIWWVLIGTMCDTNRYAKAYRTPRLTSW